MHALLALAATHLGAVRGEPPFRGLWYRNAAIRGLNQAISQTSLDHGNLDAALGATYALTFQSSYIEDGFGDFVTFLRGCSVVAAALWKHKSLATSSIFQLDVILQTKEVALQLDHSVTIDRTIGLAALQSLLVIEELCPARASYLLFYNTLVDTVQAILHQDVFAAYSKFTKVYQAILFLPQAEAKQLANLEHNTARLLGIHFIAIQAIMSPITVHEAGEHAALVPVDAMKAWVQAVRHHLPMRLEPAFRWPVCVASSIDSSGNNTWHSLCDLAYKVVNHPNMFS